MRSKVSGGRYCTRAPFDVFTIAATAGTLILLVAYVLATLGALRLLFFSGAAPGREVGGGDPGAGSGAAGIHVVPQRRTVARPAPRCGVRDWRSRCWHCVVTVVLARPAAARAAGAKLLSQQGFASDVGRSCSYRRQQCDA